MYHAHRNLRSIVLSLLLFALGTTGAVTGAGAAAPVLGVSGLCWRPTLRRRPFGGSAARECRPALTCQ
jgi:hypothetical protein